MKPCVVPAGEKLVMAPITQEAHPCYHLVSMYGKGLESALGISCQSTKSGLSTGISGVL